MIICIYNAKILLITCIHQTFYCWHFFVNYLFLIFYSPSLSPVLFGFLGQVLISRIVFVLWFPGLPDFNFMDSFCPLISWIFYVPWFPGLPDFNFLDSFCFLISWIFYDIWCYARFFISRIFFVLWFPYFRQFFLFVYILFYFNFLKFHSSQFPDSFFLINRELYTWIKFNQLSKNHA